MNKAENFIDKKEPKAQPQNNIFNIISLHSLVLSFSKLVISSLVSGYKCLMKSAEKQMTEDDTEEEMSKFRTVILLKDYFGIIYNDFKECSQFCEENCNDSSFFESKEKKSQIMEIMC